MAVYLATLTGGWTALSADALDEFRARLRGVALTPSDSGHEEERTPFNAMHAGRPALTVRCAGTEDVVNAVNLARGAETGSFAGRAGMVTSVRGGGFSLDGLAAPDGGMLIDLSAMTDVQVDPGKGVARVQGGALWSDVNRATQDFGLAAPGALVSGLGVAGLTLRGGYGWMARRHGLACDNLVEAEVVCVDGEVRTVSAHSNPDLYWAIRGGGASFGILTSLTFGLRSVGPAVAFARFFYRLEEVSAVLRGWRAYLSDVPDEVTSLCATITAPADPGLPPAIHDRPVVMVGAVHSGDADEGMSRLEPLRNLAAPLADLSEALPFAAVQEAFDPLFPRGRFHAYEQSRHLTGLGDDAIEVIAAKARDRPTPRTMVNAFHLGGAIAEPAPAGTAFPARSAQFGVSVTGMWTDPAENAERIGWVRSAAREIGRFAFDADEALPARLAEVKAAYDRANFFRMNRNVAPARTARDQPRTQS